MHLICPPPSAPNFRITFVFHFSRVLQPSQEKMKTILMQHFKGQTRCIMEMWKWRINYVTAQVKPGLCPKPRPGQKIFCVEACFGDGTCKGADKCCSNGCGHVCMKPLGMYLNYQHPCSEIRRCTVVIRIRNLLAYWLLIFLYYTLWALLLCRTGRFVLV